MAQISAEEFLDSVCTQLADGGIEESTQEGRMIVEEILGTDYSRICAGLATGPDPEEITEARVLIEKRLSGQPIAHVLGYADFYGHRFSVTTGVLVPRPETELLVDLAIRLIDKCENPESGVLDLYTGCGNVLISILKARRQAYGLGVDNDPVSLMCASRNRTDLGIPNAEFRLEDAATILKNSGRTFSVVTANPPYIPSEEIPKLQREITGYENVKALDGGPDGLDHYRMLAKLVQRVIIPGGTLLSEIGSDQKDQVSEIFSAWDIVEFRTDLRGLPRVLIAQP
jgi:release factor glutamine methyltransferase